MTDRTCTYLDIHNLLCCTECGHDLSLCTCVGPDAMAHERLHSIDGQVVRMIHDELTADRTADPDTTHRLATLMEKVGLLSTAMARHDAGLGTSSQEVLREAVQVGAAALRVATEGDGNYRYVFPMIETELPKGPVSDRF